MDLLALESRLMESAYNGNDKFQNAPTEIDVSVVIPAYNCESLVEESIRSVVGQDLTNQTVEIIAVDDGSTDSTFEVLGRLSELIEELSVFTIPNSGSASAPRNFGLDRAQGRYVFFLDSDDKLAPDTLRRMVTVGDDTGSGVVLCKLGEFGPMKRASNVPTQAFTKTLYAVDYIDSKAYTTLGALKLFRRSVLQENDIRFPLGYTIGEDQPFAMRAYFHSPHVSILSDKVYYWARGRDDGTNVTSQGQSARKHYLKIRALTEVIASGPESGTRRSLLLRRPIMSNAGIRTVFGKAWLKDFSRPERKRMVSELRNLLEPLWTDELRASGTLETQLLADLLTAGDVDSLETISNQLSNDEPIPLEFDSGHSEFYYQTPDGSKYKNFNLKLDAREEAISYPLAGIHLQGTLGIDGVTQGPDNACIVWKHRRDGTEKCFELELIRLLNTDRGTRAQFEVTVPVEDMDLTGEWDSFVEANWRTVGVRERFGKSKSSSIDTNPTYIDRPATAAVIYTRFGNLTIDVGPTRKYLSRNQSKSPEIVGKHTSFRSEISIVRGDMEYFTGAKVESRAQPHSLEATFVKYDDQCASVITPRSIFKHGPYTISLIDAEGTAVPIEDAPSSSRSFLASRKGDS